MPVTKKAMEMYATGCKTMFFHTIWESSEIFCKVETQVTRCKIVKDNRERLKAKVRLCSI